MAGETANYFWDKTRDLPDQTGFNELFPEMQKWDGKHPNQARYQTSLSPDMKLKGILMWSVMWSRGNGKGNCELF